jgi:hypothetical protein
MSTQAQTGIATSSSIPPVLFAGNKELPAQADFRTSPPAAAPEAAEDGIDPDDLDHPDAGHVAGPQGSLRTTKEGRVADLPETGRSPGLFRSRLLARRLRATRSGPLPWTTPS